MKLAPLALTLALTGSLFAQTPQFNDPANLRGERVHPRDGRELPIDTGTLGLQQLLRKLNTRASILNIVAHPDDEDGGMLTFYARGLGARVADLSLTRGEGGQNAMTGDFEDALGLLRTQELLANDRYTGVDQMFGTEVDFGFSKFKEEAFAKWTHDRVLYDAVRAIRLYRPLVITATFIGGVTDGHGQHQVSGQIAQEAFKAAGDPTVFPDMIAEGILPWQPLKVYARVPTYAITDKGLFDYATNQYTPARFTNYVTGEVTTTPPSADIIVHEGTPDPLLTTAAANLADLPAAMAKQTTPLSYIQFARIGLLQQKSQIGPGFRNAPTGAFDVAYHLYGSCPNPSSDPPKICHPERSLAAPSQGAVEGPAIKPVSAQSSDHSNDESPSTDANFFTGIDTSLESIATYAPEAFPTGALANISHSIQLAATQFDPTHPDAIAPTLATALKDLDQLITTINSSDGNPLGKANALHELRIKRVQLNDTLLLALGLHLDAQTGESDLVAGKAVFVTAQLSIASAQPIHDVSEGLLSPIGGFGGGQVPNDAGPKPTPTAPLTQSLSIRYLFTSVVTRPYFHRDNVEVPVYTLSENSLRNASASPPALTVYATLTYRNNQIETRRIVHSGPQIISIVPPVSLALDRRAQIMLAGRVPGTTIDATVHFNSFAPGVSGVDLTVPPYWVLIRGLLLQDGKTSFLVHAPYGEPLASGTVTASITLPGYATYAEGYRSVGYPGLPSTNMYTPAKELLVPAEINLPNEPPRIGYIPGTGDSIPGAIESLGLESPTLLTIADLTPTNLAQYDTVILGVRTYNAHPDLHGAPTQALLDYARNGGNVVVQYQTNEFTAEDAPYPLSLGSNEKVVDETAPVQLLDAKSPLLTTPNAVTPADFNNWISERGHGFLSTWDTHYTALTETHDPGQSPQRGGLITTPLGKGRWTYVAFALYRQLPEAVPGAYRLFLNLLNP